MENPEPLDSQYSQSGTVTKFPVRTTGLPVLPVKGKGLPQFDSTRENEYPSRSKPRLQPRLNPQLVHLVRTECDAAKPKKITLERAIEDGLRLWLKARRQSRQDSQTPTGFSGSGSGSTIISGEDLETDNLLTTTTTTVDSQPRTPALPGVQSAILELSNQPHDSRYSLEVNRAYAWESYHRAEGIKTPDLWAVSNYRTGKHDALVDMWVERKRVQVERKRVQAEAEERRAAAAEARERAEREQHERFLREKKVADEGRAVREAEELARQQAREAEQEAARLIAEEESQRKAAELNRKFEEGLAAGKKPWQIT